MIVIIKKLIMIKIKIKIEKIITIKIMTIPILITDPECPEDKQMERW